MNLGLRYGIGSNLEKTATSSPERLAFEGLKEVGKPATVKPLPSRASRFRPSGKQLAVGGGALALAGGTAALLRARHRAKKEYEAPLKAQPAKLAFAEVTEALDFEKTASLLMEGEAAAQEILRDLPCFS